MSFGAFGTCKKLSLAPSICYAFWAKVMVPPLGGGGDFKGAGKFQGGGGVKNNHKLWVTCTG